MDSLSSLALAVLVSLVTSTVVTAVMAAPLRSVLRQLCRQDDAPTFWIPFTNVMLFVAPLLFTTLFDSTQLVPSLAGTIRTALASSLFGVSVALLVVGYKIAKAQPAAR